MGKLARRDVLKIGALAATGLGFPAILRAQPKEIVILGLWDQTGAFSDVGPLNDRGMRMALEERDMKVLGRPIRYVTRDGHAGRHVHPPRGRGGRRRRRALYRRAVVVWRRARGFGGGE